MSRLIAAGRLDAPSLFIPGYVNTKRKATISYRTCGVRDPNEKRKCLVVILIIYFAIYQAVQLKKKKFCKKILQNNQ